MTTLTFPLVTERGFPHGLRCGECKRLIGNGQPYADTITGVCENGDTVHLLVCVYCAGGGA